MNLMILTKNFMFENNCLFLKKNDVITDIMLNKKLIIIKFDNKTHLLVTEI